MSGESRIPGINKVTRRRVLEAGGVLAGGSWAFGTSAGLASAAAQSEPDVYSALGVRPLINCKGTFTIITGSLVLPEVRQAMDQASRAFVHLDELMEAVGDRLARLTGAEWGIVTAGCSAAETLAACACIAGGNPERIQRLPDLAGLKDEVIVPLYSRNVYDHAIRMLGARILTVTSIDELRHALGPRTAMIYILACPEDQGPLGLQPVASLAREWDIPVLVDAAAENLTPEIHLGRGADLVAYSGGKALRGPQCAGLLLGRKDLCQAAWLNSAPHHAFGRSMKVGKEEIMGMLAAVEAWYRRDHVAEWKTWESWLDAIAGKVATVSGVTTEIRLPESLSNNAPRLRIVWKTDRLRVGGAEVLDHLLEDRPRIILAGGGGRYSEASEESWVEIMPWMMQPHEMETVAERLVSVLTRPPGLERRQSSTGEPAPIAGLWEMELEFVFGTDTHELAFEQEGGTLRGSHRGRTIGGTLIGLVDGSRIEFRSSQRYEGARLSFHFKGEVHGGSMSGTVDLGEYGPARWTARRYRYSA